MEQRTELGCKNHIDQNDSEYQGKEKHSKGLLLLKTCPLQADSETFRNLHLGDLLFDLLGNRPEVPATCVGCDMDDPLLVFSLDLGRREYLNQLCRIFQGNHFAPLDRNGQSAQVLQLASVFFRKTNPDFMFPPCDRIHIDRGFVPFDGGFDNICHPGGRQPHGRCAVLADSNLVLRKSFFAAHLDIGHASNSP